MELRPEQLAESARGFVVAGAGCGKTRLIAQTAGFVAPPRQLVLTHTHAGVHAIRNRLHELGAEPRRCAVGTIDGFALRLVRSYPHLSGVEGDAEGLPINWNAIRLAAGRFLGSRVAGEVLRASYRGVFVDEYQDCSVEQHLFVEAIAKLLPVRVLGDPLQSIFEFENIVPWTEVESVFDALPRLTVPWRWLERNPALGKWLDKVRGSLEGDAHEVEVSDGVPGLKWREATDQNRIAVCAAAISANGTVVGLFDGAGTNRAISLGSKLGGRYQVVEALDAPAALEFARQLDSSSGLARARALLKVVDGCCVRTGTELESVRRALGQGRLEARSSMAPQRAAFLRALAGVASNDSPQALLAALNTLYQLRLTPIFRMGVWLAVAGSARLMQEGRASNLADGCALHRESLRHGGRSLARRTLATTLVAKGLEFQHALVLDAESLTRKELYVTLTRGSHSLTVLSQGPRIRVRQPQSKGSDSQFRLFE